MVDDAIAAFRKRLEEVERATESQLQELVGTEVFAEALAGTMGVMMGLVRLRNDLFDSALRTLRVPSHSELTRLGGQLNRLDDKVEGLLVALERIEERLDAPARKRA